MDIVALQKMRLPDLGSVKEKKLLILLALDETREYGVVFEVRNPLLRSIVPPLSLIHI